ncbi:hypothetical protein GCM10027276_33070 [Comamonas piscis]
MSNELITTAQGTPSINDAALALFTPLEADMTALAAKFHNVAYDMSTAKGAKAARDARLELRESGRFAIQRLRDQTKGHLNDCKTLIETESTRLPAAAASRPAPAAMPQPAAPAAAGAAPAAEVDPDARVSLGQIKTLIAPLSIDAAGLEQLGFPHVATDKAKRLYRACDLPAIRQAMVQHLAGLGLELPLAP